MGCRKRRQAGVRKIVTRKDLPYKTRSSEDVYNNRFSRKWSRKELVGRLLWGLIKPLFMFSPRPMWGWRRFLLRLFGANISENVHIYPSVIIVIPWNITVGKDSAIGDGVRLYALGPIEVGERVTISQGSHLCAGSHDWRVSEMPLIKSSIKVEDDVWICADAFVGPDVTIGMRSIVSARACVMRDVGSDVIAEGNPVSIRRKANLCDE